MEFVLENFTSLSILDEYLEIPTFVGIIPNNDNYHPKINGLCAIYLGFKGREENFIIPIKHTECENHEIEEVLTYLKKFRNLYSMSKKECLYYLGSQKIKDISLISVLVEGTKIELKTPVPVIDYFYRTHSDYYPINNIIPIVKLYEKWTHIFNSVKRYMGIMLPTYFDFYNNKGINVYYLLEQQGLTVTDKFHNHFQDVDPKYNYLDNKVYTWYNPYTITTRPSNTFNRINFAALNKESGVRNEIVAEMDYLVEFDYDGSHLRLLCEQMGYELTDEPAHEQLAKLYFPNMEITKELYDKSKRITFGALYGDIPSKYEKLDFFVKLKDYIDNLTDSYKKTKTIYDSFTNRPIKIEESESSITKLLNYNIQSIEASRNISVLEKVLRYLRDKKSKLILYTYDSFLIDFSKQDGKETLQDLQNILSCENKYLVKFKYGKTLNL